MHTIIDIAPVLESDWEIQIHNGVIQCDLLDHNDDTDADKIDFINTDDCTLQKVFWEIVCHRLLITKEKRNETFPFLQMVEQMIAEYWS